MQPDRFLRAALVVALIGVLRVPVTAGSPQLPLVSPPSPAFGEFTQSVQQYLKLQNTVPRLRTTTKRQEIVERRRALALKIQEARSNAKPGDIFTPTVSAEFRRVIRSTFRGPKAPNVRKTISHGEPVPGWNLRVNGTYPDDLPLTTVPPTLLLRLPQLPSGVAYRIIGHDLVLEDTSCRLIVDFIPGVIP